jgi:hypothetical protein
MDNREPPTTPDEDKQNKKYNTENYNDEQHGPNHKPGMNLGAREGRVIPDFYKTPTVLLIYTVKSGESLASKR